MSLSVNKNQLELELAQWLHKIREEKGISQEALGIQLGKGQSDIAKIENGSKRITVIDLIFWMKALDIPTERMDEIIKPIYNKINIGKSLWS